MASRSHWYDVLLQLHEAGGRLRMQELADRVLLHKSSISRLVDRMEAAGLVDARRLPVGRSQPLRGASRPKAARCCAGPRLCTFGGSNGTSPLTSRTRRRRTGQGVAKLPGASDSA